MEVTLGLIIISMIAFVGLICVGYAVCEGEEDYLVAGLILTIIALLSCGVRYIAIDGEQEDIVKQQKYELCVKEGHEAVDVLGTKVCKL